MCVVIWLSSASKLTGPSVRGYLPYSRAVFTSIQSCVTQAFSHHSQHILASKQGDSGSSVYLQLSWTCALRAPSDYSVSLLVVGFLPQAPAVVAPFLSLKIFRLEVVECCYWWWWWLWTSHGEVIICPFTTRGRDQGPVFPALSVAILCHAQPSPLLSNLPSLLRYLPS